MVDMTDQLRVVRPDELASADPTTGMDRRRAFEVHGLWAGVVDTDPGTVSGWHHHGEHQSSLYIVAGTMRFEFGRGGASVVEAHAGDFVHVPAGVVHREVNPGDVVSRAVIARAGEGVPTVNVDGPDST
jgi:uncharacterized RmlC-like cupin family protein